MTESQPITIGIEDFRANLRQHLTDVRTSGHPLTITFHGKPYVVISPARLDEEFNGVSPTAVEFIGAVAEYHIQRTYGHDDPDGLRGARLIAIAQLMQEMPDLDDRAAEMAPNHLRSLAGSVLNVKVEEVLAARRCQCRFDFCGHGSGAALPCRGYYEADVPPTTAMAVMLCGSCYAIVNDHLDATVPRRPRQEARKFSREEADRIRNAHPDDQGPQE